ncbi:hypothetical protein NQ317_016866 [Molorchus minor]|uniref:Ig-like domain-containing protein n=1 Tax=Molorchus minor TaxID=1323400 RepID=A0ABQ9ITW4_9CUCU|nr:hypothetical protein NQ317_016866 [Molorchus minor]
MAPRGDPSLVVEENLGTLPGSNVEVSELSGDSEPGTEMGNPEESANGFVGQSMFRRLSAYLFFLTTSATASADWTAECSRCTCDWIGGKQSANCANLNLHEIPRNLSSSIQEIDFSYNEFTTLGAHEFLNANLRKVQKLSFRNCIIDTISDSAFVDLLLLWTLDLSHNEIRNLHSKTFQSNVGLLIINIGYNVISVVEDGSVLENKLGVGRIQCHQPPHLKGKIWEETSVFACAPEIVESRFIQTIEDITTNYTLPCEVRGQPIPKIYWKVNGNTVQTNQKYTIHTNITNNTVFSTLNIKYPTYSDLGEYKCVATNPGGEVENNFTLTLPPGGNFALRHFEMLRRRGRLMWGEEYLRLSDVNPIEKPPRTASISIGSGDTDLTEIIKRELQDDAYHTEHFEETFTKPMGPQKSDYYNPRVRYSPLSLQVPVSHPVYYSTPDNVPLIYRTLPSSTRYDQSHSVRPIVPTQGYVTMPRRPNYENWALQPTVNPSTLKIYRNNSNTVCPDHIY